MQSLLIAIIVLLGSLLAMVPVCYFLRPNRKHDVMQQAIGDAPRLPRGGYAAMDERAPIEAERPS
jgi:hypothetical protein